MDLLRLDTLIGTQSEFLPPKTHEENTPVIFIWESIPGGKHTCIFSLLQIISLGSFVTKCILQGENIPLDTTLTITNQIQSHKTVSVGLNEGEIK